MSTAKARILTNSGSTSFTVYGGASRSLVLSAMSMARAQRRGEVYAIIDTTNDPLVRRRFDEKIGRGMIRVVTHTDLSHVKAANVMLATDNGFTALSDAAPHVSPFCTPAFLGTVVEGLVPAPTKATKTKEKEEKEETTEPGKPPVTAPVADAAAMVETDNKPIPDARTTYCWKNQAWKQTPMSTLQVGDIFKLREDDGSYVSNGKGGVEFVVTGAPRIMVNSAGKNAWGCDAEAHIPDKSKQVRTGPTITPPVKKGGGGPRLTRRGAAKTAH